MLSRREVLAGGAATGAALLSGCFSRRTSWEFLSEREAATLGCICDQIIPADDFPSASEAGVLTFIDRQLAGHYRRYQKAYRRGLQRAHELSQARFGVEPAKATPAQQLDLAKTIENQDAAFFEVVRRHTLQGYYGSPRHGGNRDAVSWRMLGLDEPPLRGRAQYDLTAEPKR